MIISKIDLNELNENYTIRWGPQIFTGISGDIQIKVIYKNDSQKVYSTTSKTWNVNENLFIGELESKIVSIKIK